ncbi:MAG: insulinase family protein [Deltaproteobacteria bacterium]|nr:insulinase family protein [Deltaproteobacteria bacterium]
MTQRARSEEPIQHVRLSSGIPLLAQPLPGYHTASLSLRVLGGLASEPEGLQGLALVLGRTVNKGTTRRDARSLADAFDALGVQPGISSNTQSWVFSLSALPELLPDGVALVGEMLREATFPDDAVQTAISLTRQELASMEDNGRALLRRQMSFQTYGPVLGRHSLGTAEGLDRLDPALVRAHWGKVLCRSAVAVSVAGAYDLPRVVAALERMLADLPEGEAYGQDAVQTFTPTCSHIQKPLEQTQIGISYRGVPYDHPEQPVERVMLSVLSGGMGARLFTEVREKQGLVYWVSAWREHLRNVGMIHLGAATTPQRCQQTYDTLLREVARLEEDLTEEELERAKIGILSSAVTSGATVARRAAELLSDYFLLGKGLRLEEKNAAVRKVTLDDIRGYLRNHPRDALSVATVGVEPLKVTP